MVRLTDHPAMTIAVDLGRKATKQTNKQIKLLCLKSNLTEAKRFIIIMDYYRVSYTVLFVGICW